MAKNVLILRSTDALLLTVIVNVAYIYVCVQSHAQPLFVPTRKGLRNCAHPLCPRGMYDVCTMLITSMRSVSKITFES